MKGIIRFLVVYFVCIFLVKCATVVSPTGGPTDNQPPRFIASTTENFSTNFKASNIILSFDEYVRLNNASQNVSTSPPLGNNIGFKAIKNKVFITFKEDLEPDLTYHINFGNSIVDVNENNELQNFQFIFSTGDKIDSLEIKGNIDLVNDIDITASTIVGLYRDLDDSIVYKSAPFYYSIVDESGSFSFRNIKNGNYKMFVLSDANGNKYYDLPTEAIGFLPNNINLDSNLSNISIPLFVNEPDEFRVTDFTSSIKNYIIDFKFSKPISLIDKYEISVLNDSSVFNYNPILSEDRKSIKIQLDSKIDSLKSLQSVVKINEILIDTFQHSISTLEKPEFSFSLKSEYFMENDSIIINSSLPIAQEEEKIYIIDSIKQDTQQLFLQQITDNQFFIKTSDEFKKDNVYTLLIADSTFRDEFNRFNRIYTYNLKFITYEDVGILKFNFENADSSLQYILSLENEKQKSIETKIVNSNTEQWEISNLIPGTYRIKIIEDINLNGVWNSGSMKNKTYPEKISYFENEIIIRPNWELEETINFANP